MKWQGFGPEENSWLQESEICKTDVFAAYEKELTDSPTVNLKRPFESSRQSEAQRLRISERLRLKKRRR